MTTSFVRFHEFNDWEGEEWDFWLQTDGNEQELIKLADKLREESHRIGTDLWYTLHLEDVESEGVVDKLVAYATPGYMDSANKVAGKFVCPDYLGEEAENLYKGGITAYFKNDG